MKREISEAVMTKINQFFSEADRSTVITAFENADFPLAHEYERIFLAILKISQGDLKKFQRAYELANIDWRDVLVGAGMGNWDWEQRLKQEGFI